jgi:pectinesterase
MATALTTTVVLLCCGAVALAKPNHITVAEDGSGEFKTVQAAIQAAGQNSQQRIVIHIKPGTYQGPFIVPSEKPNLAFEGEDAAKTILTYALNVNDPIPAGSDKFNPCTQIRGDNFQAENVTFENTSGDHGQALALRIDSDRVVLKHCRLLGWQDTLMVNNGRQYFADCHIEGRVDFIYGSGTVVFDRCEIRSKNGGHVTAASTPKENPFGFVFMGCKLTGDPTPWRDPTGVLVPKPSQSPPRADLGRPWRPFGSVTFLNCEMADHIKPEGWNNWGKIENESTARYAEYNSTGPGANTAQRVPWSKQLTQSEAGKITLQTVLGGADHWEPAGK